MGEEFGLAALAIYGGGVDELRALLMADAGLATRVSSVGHPTLLQLVACQEPNISDPLGAAEVLVDAGASTHSPLVSAAGCDSRAVLEFLLDRGVHVNAKPPGYHWRSTALHAAVWRGDRGLVEWLLEVGADPAIRDGMVDGDAAGWAVHHGHRELVELLTVDGR